ncbi:hypothetical protein [Cystobacter ferrugineus]|uniref:hypothetical protein n=1 Tax=Cystobacter ferrugineus TaxID=83449 RepID=UPI003CCBF9F0
MPSIPSPSSRGLRSGSGRRGHETGRLTHSSPELPQNLTQAQRDAFGPHTYQRRDRPDAGFIHSDWSWGPTPPRSLLFVGSSGTRRLARRRRRVRFPPLPLEVTRRAELGGSPHAA